MALKNYTTTISVEKTIMEIEKILAKAGATHIFKMYDAQGEPCALAFKCVVNENIIAFKLPMEHNKIIMVFRKAVSEGKLKKKYSQDTQQAKRTGWRIIKDWVHSQMALMEINVVKFEEVFLPYMYDEKNDETLFQKFEKRDFNLQIENK